MGRCEVEVIDGGWLLKDTKTGIEREFDMLEELELHLDIIENGLVL